MTRFHWLIAGAIVVVAAFVMFYQLGAAPLQDYDEATYAQVTHEMRQSGNLFLLTHTGEPYFEKPPLYFWMMDASETLLGESELAMRLPSALCGVLLVVVVMLLAYELSSDAGAALLAGAILLATAPLVDTARQVRLDVPVTFFIVLAAWAFARGLKNPRWFLLFGAALGCAVMIKSYVAIFAIFAALLIALIYRRWSWLKNPWFWGGVGVSLLVALPWHLYETAVFGMTFWREYFGYTVVTRSAQDIFMVQNTNAQYVWYLSNFAWPWTQFFVLCAAGATLFWKSFAPSSQRTLLVALGMCAVVVAVFFTAHTKAPTYLTPLYPFAAILIGVVIAQALTCTRSVSKIILLCVSAFMLIGGGVSVWYNSFHINAYYAGQDELARDEKIIGQTLAATPDPFYAFETTTLSSIMFYSGDTHPLAFGGNAPAGSYLVLLTSGTAALAQLYPHVVVQTVYSGRELTLVRIYS